MYIFMMALGINPQKVGFTEKMLSIRKKSLFAVFSGQNHVKDSAYDQSAAARDEQLLAFRLAYRRNVKGELMDEYKKLYQAEGKEREEELRQKYFGIHTTTTLTYELKKPLLRIFEDELRDLR